MKSIGYSFWIGVARLLLLLLGPFRTIGRSRQPKKPGFLIISNHISDLDPLAVQLASRSHVYFMAKSELFSMRFVGKFLRYWGAFPVERGAPDRGAIKHAIALLKEGKTVCIFPEGQLSADGKLQAFLPGAMLVAKQAKCEISCLGIQGLNRIMPYGTTVPRPAFHVCTAEFGASRQATKQDDLTELAQWAHEEIARILDTNEETPSNLM